MKSLWLSLAAFAVISTVVVLADHHEHDDHDDPVAKLIERTNKVTYALLAFEKKLDDRLDPERIERAGSLRHRVEELEEDTCDDDEHQCGGDDPQCVSNLFVCDGHKDCRNGEDEKHCDLPTKAGDKFVGDVVYDHCTRRQPEHITLSIESVRTAEFFKGFPWIHVHIEMEHESDDEEGEASLPAEALYSFAQHKLVVYPPESDGLGLLCEFDGYNFDRFVGEIVHEASLERCAKFIFHRKEDHDDDDDHHDDDDDHHDNDHHDDDHHDDKKKHH